MGNIPFLALKSCMTYNQINDTLGGIVEKRPNDFDGISYFITDPADVEFLDARAAIFLQPGQINFLKNYPKSLESLVQEAAKIAEVSNLPKWLASLWHITPVLEIHTTSDLYNMNAVWLRFPIQEENEEEGIIEWKPAINLLGFNDRSQLPVPELLLKVWGITGEINHNGYGVAGRLHHPDRVSNEVAFYETLYSAKAFYRLPDMQIFWEFPGGVYESEEDRREFGLYLIDQGLSYFIDQYFSCLLEKKELRISREGEFRC
jgi:hypothetical protein